MTAAIAIQNLEKLYAKGFRREPVAAVRGVSIEIAQGEAFGFIGPNGAGKTSTIRILMGLAKPTGGTVQIFGVDSQNPAARNGLGYVPENPYLYDYLTPMEILGMGMRLHRMRKDSVRSHCRAWLDRLGIGAVADTPIRAFSKGMTQRVAIAHALCIEPRLLILDEPLSGLDPVGRRDVVGLLSEYKKKGGTLFFTSHVLHDVETLADRFGLIHAGKIRSVRSPSELIGDEEVFQVRSRGVAEVIGMREDASGRWIGEIPRAELWVQLGRLRDAGHTLLEVRSTLSLEAAFLRVIGHE
ncbi:MAG: ABC transporter ATP-binding protein [Rhodocyclales bacterium]|nr:ABC transporter ATP-binding protein [Rhodocyclales bacterium]